MTPATARRSATRRTYYDAGGRRAARVGSRRAAGAGGA